MPRALLGGTAAVVALTAGLVACDRNRDLAQTRSTDTQIAQADTAAPTALLNVGPSVPVMAPTGDMTPAVKPAKPSQRSPGSAPQMAPTGDTMPAYTPPAPAR